MRERVRVKQEKSDDARISGKLYAYNNPKRYVYKVMLADKTDFAKVKDIFFPGASSDDRREKGFYQHAVAKTPGGKVGHWSKRLMLSMLY